MALLTMCVTLSGRYKLPILREICICISKYEYTPEKFQKKLWMWIKKIMHIIMEMPLTTVPCIKAIAVEKCL